MTVNECFVGMLERNDIQDLKQKRGLHYFSIRWFHPCVFFSCSAPSQRRDHSRQEAPGDSAVPPSSIERAEMEAIKKKMQAMKVEKDFLRI